MASVPTAAVPLEPALSGASVPATDFLLVAPVVLCMAFGALLLMLRERPRLHAPLGVVGLVLLLAADLALLADVARHGPRTMLMGAWRAPFGIAFTLDATGALFLAASGIAALACGLHAMAAVPRIERRFGFFPLLFLMMAGVSGAFLTGDVFNLYVWFEVLLIASFGLLVLGSSRTQLDATTKYAFLNLVATTLFLIATGLLYGVFGTLNMADLAAKAAARGADATVTAVAALYLVAFSMKAAAFPLNAWLPASYHTPRFVVSALFAGLLTKVGAYALIRVLGMLFPNALADLADPVAWIAGLTMLAGALGALAQSDLRRLLNYVVIAGIGTVLVGLALPDAATAARTLGLAGGIVYALHSVIAMTALYLTAGIATRRAGSSSLHAMGGLWQRHPGFSMAMLAFLFAAAGLPPFSGFWPKLALLRAALAADRPWLAAALLVSSLLLTLAAARVFALAFWRPLPSRAAAPETEDLMAPMPNRLLAVLPTFGLLGIVVAAGLLPEWPMRLGTLAAAGILDPAAYVASVFGSAPP